MSPTHSPAPRIPWVVQLVSLAVPIAIVAAKVDGLPEDPWPDAPAARDAADGEDPDGLHLDMSQAERRKFYKVLTRQQDRWWRKATRKYPDDAWSRHDDFAYHLGKHVCRKAWERKISCTRAWLVVDEGIREGWPPGSGEPLEATWPALRPRTE